jgi:carboxyl-terminal processing protease
MKPFYYLFLLSMVSCPIFGQSVLNADCEAIDPTTGTGLLFWKSKIVSKTTRDENTRHAGLSSIRLQTPAGEQFVSFSQMVALPSSNSLRKYRVSCFLKRDSVAQFAGIWVNVFAGDKSLFFNNMGDKALNGTADWIEISNEFFVDEAATKVQIGGLIAGKGTAWFDDFSINEIPLNQEPLPDTLRSYLMAAFDIIQKNALRRDSVAWPKVIDRAFTMASGARNYEACYPIINYALKELGDNHSYLMPASKSKSWSASEPNSVKDLPLTIGKIIDGNYGYLQMPGVGVGDKTRTTYFADQLQNLLKTLDRSKPKGWILDLRQNPGGNCWPMLAGIGPLLGEGVCGFFMNPARKVVSDGWFYRKGKSGEGKHVNTKITRKPYTFQQKYPLVAVLTGPGTASSGEIVTVAFRKRPNTRSFGEPTTGVSTANQNYPLRDGAQILLTVSIYADRERTLYGAKIIPDEQILGGAEGDQNDPVVEAAKRWLDQVVKK